MFYAFEPGLIDNDLRFSAQVLTLHVKYIKKYGTGFRVQDLVTRVQGLVSRVQGLMSRVQGLVFRVQGLVSRVQDFVSRV